VFVCGRCHAEVAEVFPANCAPTPTLDLIDRCVDCQATLTHGEPHPPLCKRCIERKHPHFDYVED
jgi:hypothetical protein